MTKRGRSYPFYSQGPCFLTSSMTFHTRNKLKMGLSLGNDLSHTQVGLPLGFIQFFDENPRVRTIISLERSRFESRPAELSRRMVQGEWLRVLVVNCTDIQPDTQTFTELTSAELILRNFPYFFKAPKYGIHSLIILKQQQKLLASKDS